MAMVGGSVLFGDQVRFAMLSTTPPAARPAPGPGWVRRRPAAFSPEPWVIERVVEYASLLGQDDLVAAHAALPGGVSRGVCRVERAEQGGGLEALRLPASGVGKAP